MTQVRAVVTSPPWRGAPAVEGPCALPRSAAPRAQRGAGRGDVPSRPPHLPLGQLSGRLPTCWRQHSCRDFFFKKGFKEIIIYSFSLKHGESMHLTFS